MQRFLKRLAAMIALGFCLQRMAIATTEEGAGTDWLKANAEPRKVESGVLNEVELGGSYAAGSQLKQGSRNAGDIGGEGRFSASYVASIPVESYWHFRAGAAYERFDFGLPAGAWLPDNFQSVNLILGADINLSEQWLARLEIHPGLYSDFKDISADDFNVPAIVGFTYLVDSKLQWFFGLGIDPRFGTAIRHITDSPVFPGVGVRWQFADDWTLMAVLPKPELQYDATKQLQLFLGGNLLGGTYRMNEHFGDQVGRHDLNKEMLSYREIRAGLGLRYKLNAAVSAEVNGGYIVDRSFDFPGRDLTLHTDPAPYGAVQLKANF